jgi:hypothetical protein
MRPGSAILLALTAAAARAATPTAAPLDSLARGPLATATNMTEEAKAAALSSPLPAPSPDAEAAVLVRPASVPVPDGADYGAGFVETCALPLGLHETGGRGARGGLRVGEPSDILLCTPEAVRAVCWRFRRGLGPETVPVDLEHASAAGGDWTPLGRVEGVRFDESRGCVVRIALTPAGAEAVATGRFRVSPELVVVRAISESGDRLSIPWAIRSLALTADPALDTPRVTAESD